MTSAASSTNSTEPEPEPVAAPAPAPAPDPTPSPAATTRLRLKPDGPATGSVDGAWWPRSRDLAAELPGLFAALTDRLGRIEFVSYHLGDWAPAPRKLTAGGGSVRLGGYRFQRTGSVDVVANARRVTLAVIPPGAAEQPALAALAEAADRDNRDTVEALLAEAHPTSPDQQRNAG
jgi:hypothetical protein